MGKPKRMADQPKNRTLLHEEISAPIDRVFDALADHDTMGSWLDANIRRTKNSEVKAEGPNGTGSIRTIKMFGLVEFDETVVVFKKPNTIEYKITRGSPLRNHHGRINLIEKNGKTEVTWDIRFDMAIPFTGALMAWLLKTSVGGGLRKLKSTLEKK